MFEMSNIISLSSRIKYWLYLKKLILGNCFMKILSKHRLNLNLCIALESALLSSLLVDFCAWIFWSTKLNRELCKSNAFIHFKESYEYVLVFKIINIKENLLMALMLLSLILKLFF